MIKTIFAEAKRIGKELAKYKNNAIKKAYTEGYDWITFNTTMGNDKFITQTKAFKGELKNPKLHDEILDLKALRDQYNGASIEFIEDSLKRGIKND